MGQRLTVLVAGITGQLGRGLVSVCEGAGVRIVPIARGIGRLSGRDRLGRALADQPWLGEAAVTGDISRPRWGLTDEDLDQLAPDVDIVLNVAAETNWSTTQRRLHSANVLGALHGLDVAMALQRRHPRCGAYVHGSSIYVAGGEVGWIPESPLGPQRDRTPYEHSKWLAEQYLVRRASDCGVSVGLARIGGLLGDSQTASTAKRNSLYLIADRESSGRSMIPVTPGGRVDMLPRDMAAGALLDAARGTLRLASHEPQITHVCAGERAPTLNAVFAALDSVGFHSTSNRPLTFPAPEQAVFQLSAWAPDLLHMKQQTRNLIEGLRYVCLDRVFERDRLARFMPGQPPAPSAELLARLAFDRPERTAFRREPDRTFARFA